MNKNHFLLVMGIKFYSCFVRFGKQGNIFIKEITANAKRRSEDKLVTKFKVYESVYPAILVNKPTTRITESY